MCVLDLNLTQISLSTVISAGTIWSACALPSVLGSQRKKTVDLWGESEQAFQRWYMKKFISTPVLKQGEGHLPDKSIHSSGHSHPQMDSPPTPAIWFPGRRMCHNHLEVRDFTASFSCFLYGDNCQLRKLLDGENLPQSFMLLFNDFNTKDQTICHDFLLTVIYKRN